ncbi:MAG TPA: class I SAM-dependent methyltransferase [Saprospiraceae bacterium]|nr:class I SAM-dependent methyltransferase [Saprospiraceae bacterium]
MGSGRKKTSIKWRLAQFLEIRWWQQYLRKKGKEEYLEAKRAYWQRVLDRLDLEVPDAAHVLDAGCGPAGIFMILPRREVVAVDPLLAAYAEKLAHFSPERYPWVHFETMMLEAYQAPKLFDYVFCLNAINHVADLRAGISVVAKATKPEGQLIISIDTHRFWGLKWLFRLLPGDALHPHQHSLADYEALLQQQGFSLTQKVKLKPGWIFDYWILVLEKA